MTQTRHRWWLAVVLAAGAGAQAESLGVIGPVYRISEEDLLAMIERRLREKEASGELARLRAQAVENSKIAKGAIACGGACYPA